MAPGAQRPGRRYGSDFVLQTHWECPQGQQPGEEHPCCPRVRWGWGGAWLLAPPTPMDILVNPWVAHGICPFGTHVLLEYEGRCTEATWPQSVVGMAQGPSPLHTCFASNAV